VQAPAAQANLLNTLGSELKITPEQAIGGAGAMLGWRATTSAAMTMAS
jgi:hypothetical protein